MAFENGQNPDSTDFTVNIVINSDTLYWNDAIGDTTSVEYAKTAAAWGDTISIGESGFLTADTIYPIGIHGQNADNVWTENWYTVKTSENPAQITINLNGASGTLSEFKNAAGLTAYGTARSVAGSDSIDTVSALPELGQCFDSSDYYVKRLGLETVLPAGYEARAGSLYFYVTGDSTNTDFDISAYDGEWSGSGFDDEAFWKFDGRQAGTTAHTGTSLTDPDSTSGMSANNWYYLTYNDNGLSALTSALGDTLRNTIISSRDSSASPPSGNEFFTIDPDSSYLTFSIDLPDTLPGNFTLTSVSADSIFAQWTDRNHSEEQYQIVEMSDSTAVSDTLTAGTESTGIGGLSANTHYRFMLKVLGGNLNSRYSDPDSVYSLANVPGKPSLYFAGGNMQDDSGSGNDGFSTAASFLEDDRSAGDHAYGFNGTSSYITSPDTTDFDFTDSFTLACRIMRTGADTTYNRVITYENSSEEASYRLLFNDNNQLYFQIDNGTTVSTGYTPALTEDVWYHVAGTFDSGMLRIYVDGDSVNTASAAGDDITLYADRILSIGRSPSGGETYLKGSLDDVRIYNRALTPAQIDSLDTYGAFADYELGPELITNGSMEINGNWSNYGIPAAQVQSSEQAHSASYSLKVTLNGSGTFAEIQQSESGIVIGNAYRVSAWFYNLDMTEPQRMVLDCGGFSSGGYTASFWDVYCSRGSWVRCDAALTADDSSGYIQIYDFPTEAANAGSSFYVDDVSLKLMDYTSTSLKLHYSFDLPDSLMIFKIDPNNNPSYTHFAVQDSVSGYYIDATAEPESLSTLPLGEWGWRTYGEWGAAFGDSLSGFTPGNLYVLRAKARNGE
jgi:hypothetical protein